MSSRFAAVFAAALLAGATSAHAEDAIAWLVDAGKAIKQAQAEHKPVFVDVWAVACRAHSWSNHLQRPRFEAAISTAG